MLLYSFIYMWLYILVSICVYNVTAIIYVITYTVLQLQYKVSDYKVGLQCYILDSDYFIYQWQ